MASNKDVAFFAVLAEVETFDLGGSGDPQAHHGVEHLEDNERADDRQAPADHDGNELGLQQRAAFEQAEQLAALDGPGGPGGEDAGENGAQRAAHAVHAEDVERVVVAESRLYRRAGSVADRAAGHADHQRGHERDIAGRRRNADQPGHHARTAAQNARLSAVDPLHAGPGQAAGRGGEVRGGKGTGRQPAGAQGAAGIEAEPADPQHRGAQWPCRSGCAAASARCRSPAACPATGHRSRPTRRN